ncbi:MAG: YceI family protein [Gammaproteobacteria bacterium]|nr:MAG: YceI family protein [Gammaproteobacteria bacterium]
MKRLNCTLISVLTVVTALAAPAGVAAGELSPASASEVIDPGKVDVRFKVRVFGVLNIMGHFNRLYGRFVSNTQGGRTGVRMQIDASSVTTDDEWRDDFLRGPSFFATDRYPHITFSGACLARGENGAMQLAGNLSLRGTSRPVVFEFDSVGAKSDSSAAIYQARTVIRRSEFGLNAMEHLISDEVEIIVAMQSGATD